MPITKLQQITYDAYLRNDKSIRPTPRDLGLAYLGVRRKIIAAEKRIIVSDGQKRLSKIPALISRPQHTVGAKSKLRTARQTVYSGKRIMRLIQPRRLMQSGKGWKACHHQRFEIVRLDLTILRRSFRLQICTTGC